jgi:SAM-dependent methyltransferase
MGNITVSDKLQANYDDYYHGESEWRRLGAIDKAKNIVSLCSSYAHASILEIGCGEGAILNRLSELHFGDRLFAIEISRTAVEVLEQRRIASLVECKLFDGYTVPYADKQFDLVILSHVVEHLEFPRKLLYEAHRVAKYVFVEVPLELHWRLGSDFVFNSVGHINFYSPKVIRRLLQTCDLDVLHQLVTNPSRRLYEYQSGKKGLAKYLVRELLLRSFPPLATNIFTYHYSAICASKAT